jgi:gliding motility-associated-like protein
MRNVKSIKKLFGSPQTIICCTCMHGCYWLLLSLSFFFAAGKLAAQHQDDYWYFGNHAGLHFGSGGPTALTNGQLYAYEGTATVSNNLGNLLFYTNGIQVWNRNHVVMPNGSGLLGHNSSSQSALIVPDPGNPDEYYIFTVDELAGPNGIRYSKVNMTLQGGNGDVVASQKNISLHSSSTEKITAIQQCNGNIWVISHEWGTNQFFADHITPAGISPSVISAVGVVHSGGANPGWNSVGYMKPNQQGTRLALAIRDMKMFQVFDFDINTGVVSNPITLSSPFWGVVYGVEFSLDGTKLYTTEITAGRVHQFDLSQGTQAAIQNSDVVVGSVNRILGALQLGPDGKIYGNEYVTSAHPLDSLCIIAAPNASGTACAFMINAISLTSGGSLSGLPNLMVRPFLPTPLNLSITGNATICLGTTTVLTAAGADSYLWSGNGVSSSGASIAVSPTITTTYTVQGTNACFDKTDSITVVVGSSAPLALSITGDSVLCEGEETLLTASGGGQYAWSGNGVSSSASTIQVDPIATSTYYVTASTTCSSVSDSFKVNVYHGPHLVISGSTIQCPGDEITLTASGAALYSWNGAAASADSILHTGALTASATYYVTGSNFCGSKTDSVVVLVGDNARPVFEYVYVPCSGAVEFTNRTESNASYLWDFGDGNSSPETNPSHVYEAGVYNVALICNPSLPCADTASFLVDAETGSSDDVWIPNSFTPDGDGKNDDFVLFGSADCVPGHMYILDRWGELIWETDQPFTTFWNGKYKGKLVEEGAYAWLLSGESIHRYGYVSVIR